MHKPLFSHCLAAGLLLAGLFSHAAMAAKPAPNHTGSAAEVLSISDAQVAVLQANFSNDRRLLTQRSGEKIYQAICQGCHMPQAQGSQGAGFYPPLAANPKLAAATYPVGVVMNGLHGMPGFADRLSNEQVSDVVNYVRSHFGNNHTDAVTAETVQLFRK